jgi:prevent-host-death family protein
MVTKIKSGEARARFRDLLDQVLSGKGDVIIERNGKNVAVIIPAVDYEQVKDKLQEVRAVRETNAAYETLQSASVTIDSKEGTATIPIDVYQKLVAERDARFEVIDRIRALQPDFPPEEVERDVAEAVARVRKQNATRGH